MNHGYMNQKKNNIFKLKIQNNVFNTQILNFYSNDY